MQFTQILHKCRIFANTDSINKMSFPAQSVRDPLSLSFCLPFFLLFFTTKQDRLGVCEGVGCLWGVLLGYSPLLLHYMSVRESHMWCTHLYLLRSNTIFGTYICKYMFKSNIRTPIPTLCITYSRSFGLKICSTHHRRRISDYSASPADVT